MDMEIDEKECPRTFDWRNHPVNGRYIMPAITQQLGETCFAHAIAKAVEARLRLMLAKMEIPCTFDRQLDLTYSMAQADISIQQVIDELYNQMEIQTQGLRIKKVFMWYKQAKFTTTFLHPNRKDWSLNNTVRISDLVAIRPVRKNDKGLRKILIELLKFGPVVAYFDIGYEDWDELGRSTYKAKGKHRKKRKGKEREEQGDEDPSQKRAVRGHMVVISGYDKSVDGGCFFYQNSMGPHFGQSGYGRMTFRVPNYFLAPRVVIERNA